MKAIYLRSARLPRRSLKKLKSLLEKLRSAPCQWCRFHLPRKTPPLVLMLPLLWGPFCSQPQAGESSVKARPAEPLFTHSPLEPDNICSIIPLGNVDPRGGHVLPADHVYFDYGGTNGLSVFAPAAGTVYAIRGQIHGGSKIEVRANENVSYYVAHVLVDSEVQIGRRVRVGQLLGKVSGDSMLDLGACDTRVRLPGLANPDRYPGPTLQTVAPLALFVEPLRSRLYAKVSRQGADKDGKIDFDQTGKLVGNWFHETLPVSDSARGGPEISAKQLAFVYDVQEPAEIRISVGGTVAPTGLYRVQNAAPDPATVGVDTGLVLYQLSAPKGEGASHGLVGPQAGSENKVLLVQVLSGRKIRVEYVSGRPTVAIRGFSTNATIFER